jgi:hypothetical protein
LRRGGTIIVDASAVIAMLFGERSSDALSAPRRYCRRYLLAARQSPAIATPNGSKFYRPVPIF